MDSARILAELKALPAYRGQLVHVATAPAHGAAYARLAQPLPAALDRALKTAGIQRLYQHQTLAIDAARSGRFAAVVTATATSSGKSLGYNVPVLAAILDHRDATTDHRPPTTAQTRGSGTSGRRPSVVGRQSSVVGRRSSPRALYLFPTKALAQDQQRALTELLAHLDDRPPTTDHGSDKGQRDQRSSASERSSVAGGRSSPGGIFVATYDGDTPVSARGRIRKDADIVITNPDMLHVGILPNHHLWKGFFTGLRYVVIDEAHVYRGVFGGHVANVLRRLRRLCAFYGSAPVFLCASATIANPAEHVARLTATAPETIFTVSDDGAPTGPRTFALWNPPFVDRARTARRSAQTEATTLFTELTRREVRNITFTRSQKTAELILRYARDQLRLDGGHLAERVAAYRAGYLPAQRREIEQALFKGQLIGVTATNALELGVDIGNLDATVHVGYPGTIASLRQQAGRAGRGTRPALGILIGQDNPLDQYFMRHPEDLLGRTPEHALIDPDNPYIVADHVRCAVHEGSLTTAEGRRWFGPTFEAAADGWREQGVFTLRGGATEADDRWYYAPTDYPAQDVGIRSVGGHPIRLVDEATGAVLEEIDASAAFQRVFPGAVYLHQGETCVVEALDLRRRVALSRREDVNYYTEAREFSDVRLGGAVTHKLMGNVRVYYGHARVREQVVSFRRLQQFTETVLDEAPLSLPANTFATMATWWDMPPRALDELGRGGGDWLAAMHAAEHACIGILPLFAMCDRWDIGGLSINVHPDTGKPQIIIYDGYPGGVGITEKGYDLLAEWWAATLRLIEECPCEGGCPSCVQSPKCGNNNDRLDKDGAAVLLRALLADLTSAPAALHSRKETRG